MDRGLLAAVRQAFIRAEDAEKIPHETKPTLILIAFAGNKSPAYRTNEFGRVLHYGWVNRKPGGFRTVFPHTSGYKSVNINIRTVKKGADLHKFFIAGP
jgi:hypothetical protein